jgi:hypothetical protein
LHARLSATASRSYEPIQMANAKNIILDILNDPKNHQEHAKRYSPFLTHISTSRFPNFLRCDRYAASVIMTMTYGKSTPTSYSDYEVIQLNKCLHRLGITGLPGAWLVDSYPILRYVPGYLNQLKQWHLEELQLFTEQLDVVRKAMV